MTENEQSDGEGGGRQQAEFELAFSGSRRSTYTRLHFFRCGPQKKPHSGLSSLHDWTMDGLLLSVTVESSGQGCFKEVNNCRGRWDMHSASHNKVEQKKNLRHVLQLICVVKCLSKCNWSRYFIFLDKRY